jgi:hypothetical protein
MIVLFVQLNCVCYNLFAASVAVLAGCDTQLCIKREANH